MSRIIAIRAEPSLKFSTCFRTEASRPFGDSTGGVTGLFGTNRRKTVAQLGDFILAQRHYARCQQAESQPAYPNYCFAKMHGSFSKR